MADACTPSPSEESDSNESVGLSFTDGFSKSSSDSSEDDSRSGLGKPAAPSQKRVCYQSPEGAKGRVRLVGGSVCSREKIRSKLLDSPWISFSEGSKKMKRPKPSSSRRASIEEELKIVHGLIRSRKIFATDSNLKKFPIKFIKMCQKKIVKLKERLEMEFRLIVSSLLNKESTWIQNLWIVSTMFWPY